jgi:putative AlgH/UPF0301 family transcriptional regulator
MENELSSGSWLVSEIDEETILNSDDCWESLVKEIGHTIMLQQIDLPISTNPELN